MAFVLYKRLEDPARRQAVRRHGRELSLDTVPVGTLISDFQPPELGEINVCGLCHPVCHILLEQPKLIQ